MDRDLLKLLYNAGYRTPETLQQAYGVAMAESNARPGAHNPDASTGDDSYGMFQINMLGNLGTQRDKLFREKIPGYVDRNSLFDPNVNARAAAYMSRAGKIPGTDWGGWTTYGGSRYKDLLPDINEVTKLSQQFAPIDTRWGEDVAYKGGTASYGGGGNKPKENYTGAGEHDDSRIPDIPDTASQQFKGSTSAVTGNVGANLTARIA